jgi:hypothetical protein
VSGSKAVNTIDTYRVWCNEITTFIEKIVDLRNIQVVQLLLGIRCVPFRMERSCFRLELELR